jgi:hypothetical protein
MNACAPLLTKWFDQMDGDTPEQVLDYITDDFHMSVVFSTGEGGTAADFSGDREALIGYLDQRLKSVRTHHILSAAKADKDELVVGEVRQRGVYEASFVAAARVEPDGRASRLLIGRAPGTVFGDG